MPNFTKAREIAMLLAEGKTRKEVMEQVGMKDHRFNQYLKYLSATMMLPRKTSGYQFIDKDKMIENINNAEGRIDRANEFHRQENERAKKEMHNLTGRD